MNILKNINSKSQEFDQFKDSNAIQIWRFWLKFVILFNGGKNDEVVKELLNNDRRQGILQNGTRFVKGNFSKDKICAFCNIDDIL